MHTNSNNGKAMSNKNLSAAAIALKVWQAQNGLTNNAAAEMIGVSPNHYSGFRTGHKQPGGVMREKIAELTNRAVRPADWSVSPPPVEPSVAMMELNGWRNRGAHKTEYLAAAFDVSRQVVSYYLNGRMSPSPSKRAVIERLTGGAVRAQDWDVPHVPR
jgi:transcriptional regulator with XRE-family HTH domain